MEQDGWHYLDGTTPVGPFDLARLHELRAKDLIGPATLVWVRGRSDWEAYGALFPERAPASPPMPPPPPPPAPPSLAKAPSPTAPPAASPVPRIGVEAAGSVGSHGEAAAVPGWNRRPPTPWRRYAARVLDTLANGALGFFAIGFVFYALAPATADRFFLMLETPAGPILDTILTALVASLVGGVLVGLTGMSLGKLAFGIKVVDPAGEPIGVGAGVRRDLEVWMRGLAFGIPLIVIVTLIISYQKLKRDGATWWDEGRFEVHHRPSGPLQYVLNAVGIVLIVVLFGAVSALGQM